MTTTNSQTFVFSRNNAHDFIFEFSERDDDRRGGRCCRGVFVSVAGVGAAGDWADGEHDDDDFEAGQWRDGIVAHGLLPERGGADAWG